MDWVTNQTIPKSANHTKCLVRERSADCSQNPHKKASRRYWNWDRITDLLNGYGWRWYVTKIKVRTEWSWFCHSDWFRRMAYNGLSCKRFSFPSFDDLYVALCDCFFSHIFVSLGFVCHFKEKVRICTQQKNNSCLIYCLRIVWMHTRKWCLLEIEFLQ